MWQSEGGSSPNPPYSELVVDAFPYGNNTVAIKAVALTTNSHSRLESDACPSKRYMKILISGARELDLSPGYVSRLEAIKTQVSIKLPTKFTTNAPQFSNLPHF